MTTLRRAHTADLTDDELRGIRAFLERAFEGEFSDADWDGALGGVHLTVHDGSVLVGHVSVVQRRFVHLGRAIRTGYVEAVATRSDRRGEGIAGKALEAAERLIVRAYDLGALCDGSGIDRFYERRGWIRWRGPTAVVTPEGIRPTPEDDGGVLVLPTPTSPELELASTLACDWRTGDVW